ncbi:HAMP domain-containing sensor histidine kinase [Nocardioides sp.]|uniref:sensor histidine kinase n=1 Tax=Nocardioides sp. TaxID=35761 RepID=UPI0025FED9FD|nr:HAMP domain-containing sensor histidine kinase [Nocardioides sp.]
MTIFPTLPPEGRWHYRRSLASRVTLLTTIAVGLTVAFVAAGAYLTVRMQEQATLDDSLLDRAHSSSADQVCGTDAMPAALLQAAGVWVACFQDTPLGVASGKVPFRLGAPEQAVWAGERPQSTRTIIGSDGTHWRVVALHRSSGETIVLAQSLESQQTVLRKLGIVMLLFGLAGVIAAGMAGWAVARNGLRPVRRLTSSVEHIARTEDLRPLPVEGDDEIARLATAFNQMLAALAASRDRQRQLVADAGHELRTPLTSLRTNLDLLSQADSAGGLPPEAKAELLDDVRAQIEEMTTLIGDLMELSRDEPLTHVVEAVDVPELVDRAIGRVRRRAPSLTLDVATEPWYVVGESAGLERAVTNLLDNAAKWSPPGGTVTVRLVGGTLTVDDEGPGIAEEDLPHVFDRFYRSEESRSMPGSGLGLSIVRQVAERHSGSVTAGTSPAGGARLSLWLPGSHAPVPDWTPAP